MSGVAFAFGHELPAGLQHELEHGSGQSKEGGHQERGGVGEGFRRKKPQHGAEYHAERHRAAEYAYARAYSAFGHEIHGNGGLRGGHGGKGHAVQQAYEHEERHPGRRKAEGEERRAAQRGEDERMLPVEPVGNEAGEGAEEQGHQREHGERRAHDAFGTVHVIHEVEGKHRHDGIARHAGAEVGEADEGEIPGKQRLPGTGAFFGSRRIHGASL